MDLMTAEDSGGTDGTPPRFLHISFDLAEHRGRRRISRHCKEMSR